MTTAVKYKLAIEAAPYLDGSGFKARAVVEPNEETAGREPAVRLEVTWRLSEDEWIELVKHVNTAFDAARELGDSDAT